MSESDQVETRNLAETENFMAWEAEDPEDESTFHLELGGVTVHFYQEEWEEFLTLVSLLK